MKMAKDGILDGIPVTTELMWGWGDDASKTKGLWRRALVRHHHAPSMASKGEMAEDKNSAKAGSAKKIVTSGIVASSPAN